MQTPQLILLLVLVLVVAVVVVLVLRRSSAKRDEQRVEAAGIRGEAEGMAATMTGQATFAQQAAERAEVARIEAEERAREAARLEEEAAEQRAAAEATRREYEAAMRRADDIDPDVKESTFAPVPAATSPDAGAAPFAGESPVAEGTADPAPAAHADGHADGHADDADAADAGSWSDPDDLPMTRAERRQAREEAGSTPAPLTPAGPGAVAAGAAAAGAVSASTWGTRGADEASPESRRIASADDFRDEVPRDAAAAGPVGDHETPDHDTSDHDTPDHDTSDHDTRDHGTPDPDRAEDTLVSPAAAGGTAAVMSQDQQHAAPADTAHDLSRDTESPRGEWGGPPADAGDADVVIVSDTDAYASTEPLAVDEQETPGQGTPDAPDERDADTATEPLLASDTANDTGRAADERAAADEHAAEDHPADDHSTTGHAPAETGAAVAEPDADTRASAADRAEVSPQERFDPTPTHDWAADEGELLEETQHRGERLEQERHELEEQAAASGAASPLGDGTASAEPTASDDAHADDAGTAAAAGSDDSVDQAVGRRVSDFHELRDGGFGVGSAAPLDDGAQPLDHPVQAYRDTMTFRLPGDAGYDSAEPDVWFYDQGAAERNGFHRAQG